MTEYIKINKKRRIYIYKVEQKDNIRFKLSNSFKYYPSYHVSLLLYGNLYCFFDL